MLLGRYGRKSEQTSGETTAQAASVGAIPCVFGLFSAPDGAAHYSIGGHRVTKLKGAVSHLLGSSYNFHYEGTRDAGAVHTGTMVPRQHAGLIEAFLGEPFQSISEPDSHPRIGRYYQPRGGDCLKGNAVIFDRSRQRSLSRRHVQRY